MTIESDRIVASPNGSAHGRIRAKLFNLRLGLKDILIDSAAGSEIDALAISVVPEIGEAVTILLPTGEELTGIVTWAKPPSFSVSLADRTQVEARNGSAPRACFS